MWLQLLRTDISLTGLFHVKLNSVYRVHGEAQCFTMTTSFLFVGPKNLLTFLPHGDNATLAYVMSHDSRRHFKNK